MVTEQVREALAQVKQLREAVLERQRFGGYSGPARAISGTIALLAAAVMSRPFYPATTKAHILGWGAVFIVASLLNAGALLYWFLHDPHVKRNVWRLKPILDSLPSLVVGGALTACMILYGFSQYLFGVWMCMFGLTNLATRHVLPRLIGVVGVFYVLCGIAWLLTPHASFVKPWPMGLVFFAGEWAGGLLLYFDERRYLSFVRYQNPDQADRESGKEAP